MLLCPLSVDKLCSHHLCSEGLLNFVVDFLYFLSVLSSALSVVLFCLSFVPAAFFPYGRLAFLDLTYYQVQQPVGFCFLVILACNPGLM